MVNRPTSRIKLFNSQVDSLVDSTSRLLCRLACRPKQPALPSIIRSTFPFPVDPNDVADSSQRRDQILIVCMFRQANPNTAQVVYNNSLGVVALSKNVVHHNAYKRRPIPLRSGLYNFREARPQEVL